MTIPDDLDEITTELVSAVDRADNDEDQSERNLNFVFEIIENVANNCSDDDVSTDCNKYFSNCVIIHTCLSVLPVAINLRASRWH